MAFRSIKMIDRRKWQEWLTILLKFKYFSIRGSTFRGCTFMVNCSYYIKFSLKNTISFRKLLNFNKWTSTSRVGTTIGKMWQWLYKTPLNKWQKTESMINKDDKRVNLGTLFNLKSNLLELKVSIRWGNSETSFIYTVMKVTIKLFQHKILAKKIIAGDICCEKISTQNFPSVKNKTSQLDGGRSICSHKFKSTNLFHRQK